MQVDSESLRNAQLFIYPAVRANYKKTKEMKKAIIIILTLTTLNVVGQNHLIGIKGSTNWTNISSSDIFSGTDYRTGLSGGLTYEYLFRTHLSLGVDLIYNQRGFTDNVTIMDNQGIPTGDKAKYKYDYVSIPFKTGYNIGNTFYSFANIGLIPSLLVNAKLFSYKIEADGKVVGSDVLDMTNEVTKFDLAGLFEIGGGYKFKNGYWLFSSIGYQQSFTTITNSEYFANSKIRHNGINFTIGLKYALTK